MSFKTIFSLPHIIMGLCIIGIALFFIYYWKKQRPRLGTTEWIDRVVTGKAFSFTFTHHKLTRFDYIPLAVIALLFGILSFMNLGDMDAPQTFLNFEHRNDSRVYTLDGERTIDEIWYYTGLNNGSYGGEYKIEYSTDGENWECVKHDVYYYDPADELPEEERYSVKDKPFEQSYAHLFSWIKQTTDKRVLTPSDKEKKNEDVEVSNIISFTASYIRVTSTAADKTELGELALYSGGELVTPLNPDELFDEQEKIPDEPTYMNSMYFDEIYHGRAALEIIRGEFPYEWVHPPLGKVLISVGIRIFGMTPFGWRCVGALFGVLMLAAIYVFLKNAFGKPMIAICGTLLLAFDFMRFTQSRISTVDQFPTFFIIMAYLFMYRFLCMSHTRKVREVVRPLFFAGLFWGLGAASKWTVIYAGVGLAILFFVKLAFDIKANINEGNIKAGKRAALICLAAFGCFLIMPAIIYVLAYTSYGYGSSWIDAQTYPGMSFKTDERLNMTISNGMLWNPRFYQRILKIQKGMYDYHAKLAAYKEVVRDGVTVLEKLHPYQSTWLQWIFDVRPILYYWKSDAVDFASRHVITAFTNPIVTWAGITAIVGLIVETFRKRDAFAMLIVVGYLSQIVPWMLITRCVFAYHYFPSLIFLVIAIAYYFNAILDRDSARGKYVVVGFTAVTGLIFVMFFPVLSGLKVSGNYVNTLLQWVGSWQL